VPPAVIHEPRLGVQPLAREPKGGLAAALLPRDLPPGVVFNELLLDARGVGDDVHPAQVVGVVEARDAGRGLRGDQLPTDPEILGRQAVGPDLVLSERSAPRPAPWWSLTPATTLPLRFGREQFVDPVELISQQHRTGREYCEAEQHKRTESSEQGDYGR
jgi:hypothetical protein